MRNFEYFAPTSTSEATRLLAEAGEAARPLAGGTDLTTQLKEGRRRVERVVDLKRIPELTQIDFDPQKGLRIGAAVRCAAIHHHPAVRRHYPALAAATGLIGSVQIQNRASLGGNLCNAAPSADGVPALIAHAAAAVIAGRGGTRRLAVEAISTGPGKTCLEPGEIVVAFELPPPAPHTGSHYVRFIPRNEMDIAVVGVGASLTLDAAGGVCRSARIALAAVAPTPLRVSTAEAALVGQQLTSAAIERAAELAAAAARPISDVRGSADYRRHLVQVLTRRAIETVLGRVSA